MSHIPTIQYPQNNVAQQVIQTNYTQNVPIQQQLSSFVGIMINMNEFAEVLKDPAFDILFKDETPGLTDLTINLAEFYDNIHSEIPDYINIQEIIDFLDAEDRKMYMSKLVDKLTKRWHDINNILGNPSTRVSTNERSLARVYCGDLHTIIQILQKFH